MRPIAGTITEYRPNPELLRVSRAARVRVERPELFDPIEVAAAQSWLQSVRTGGISITRQVRP